jgi:hypothetical protein
LDEKASEYLEMIQGLKDKVSDEEAACAIIQEATKDLRMAQIREERSNTMVAGDDESATPRQISFINRLGVRIPAELTKTEASALIDKKLDEESE